MNSQAQIEVGFWSDLLRQKGPDGFIEQRQEDWRDIAAHFPVLPEFFAENPTAKVLEIGTGLVSPLEFADFDGPITAIDPLMNEYQNLVDLQGARFHIQYLAASGEAIPFPPGEDLRGSHPMDGKPTPDVKEAEQGFDAVVCINVIDHTPNPELLLQEAKRVLKPGGKLFFEVNFDPALSPAHYGLWDQAKVQEMLKDWKFVESMTDERPEHGQTRYWAVYAK